MLVPNYDNRTLYVLGPADLTAKDIASAQAVPATTGIAGFQIELRMTAHGAQALDQVAAARFPFYEQNPSNPPVESLEAIEVGGVVESAPAIEASSFNGFVIITHTSPVMTASQATQLVQAIEKAIAA